MSHPPLFVNIMWHMHQPFYKDLGTGEYMMPWVRLHATKDYLDMPLLLDEFANVRVTFNMVPSLLEQIEDYAADRAEDPYLRLARKPPEALTADERVELVQNFFNAQPNRMIRPQTRYQQLYERRGWASARQDLHRAAQTFSNGDLRDLQVWFYLAWIDPYLRARDERLQALVKKGARFSEEDKQQVLEIGRQLVSRIIPEMKRLWDEGRIELTTTPYYHPILPLLIDTDLASRARPKICLPAVRFQRPEDAQTQIRMGLDYIEERFGRRPTGMWPSEGSVCPEILPMMHKEGVRWVASDEEVLACSLGNEGFSRDKGGRVNHADALYRPYRVEGTDSETALFFRDHHLSDLIGFKYMNWNPEEAAADLIGRLEAIGGGFHDSSEPHMVSIILDGENCWEHYDQDGLPFLRALYGALDNHKGLQTITPSEYLERYQEQRWLKKLHSGSWINHDYGVWIGHAEDNLAWEMLARVREEAGRVLEGPNKETIDPEARKLAWRSILVAEGSDWNWWYGDDHSSGIDDQFDALYRRHLINAYTALGLDVPGKLLIPIAFSGDTGLQSRPFRFIRPVLDGRVTNYYEWFPAGLYDPQRGGGSMHQSEFAIESLYFGFDAERFYVRLDMAEPHRPDQSEPSAQVVIYLLSEKNYRIECSLKGGEGDTPGRVFEEDPQKGWVEQGAYRTWAAERIVEMAFEHERFGIQTNTMLHFQVALEVEGREVERCPAQAPLSTRIPAEDFEERMWIL